MGNSKTKSPKSSKSSLKNGHPTSKASESRTDIEVSF